MDYNTVCRGDQKLKCKDIVNIKAYYDSVMEVWRVDHTQGFIVKHPDILISGTALSGSLFCQRRAVLNYLYPGLDCTNSSMLIGTMVHVLLQEVSNTVLETCKTFHFS